MSSEALYLSCPRPFGSQAFYLASPKHMYLGSPKHLYLASPKHLYLASPKYMYPGYANYIFLASPGKTAEILVRKDGRGEDREKAGG